MYPYDTVYGRPRPQRPVQEHLINFHNGFAPSRTATSNPPQYIDTASRQETPVSIRDCSGQSRLDQDKQGPMLWTDYDIKMASRQTCIESLPPKERQEQEKWAHEQLKQIPGACVDGYSYTRVCGGYVCQRNICLITDELLAEGRAGYHLLCLNRRSASSREPTRHGPFYLSDEEKVLNGLNGMRQNNTFYRPGISFATPEGFGGCRPCSETWTRAIMRKQMRNQIGNGTGWPRRPWM